MKGVLLLSAELHYVYILKEYINTNIDLVESTLFILATEGRNIARQKALLPIYNQHLFCYLKNQTKIQDIVT